MEKIQQLQYNLVYIDLSEIFIDAFNCVNIFRIHNISDRDLKKLAFHFVVKNLLCNFKQENIKEKVVFFTYENYLNTLEIRIKKIIVYILNTLKQTIPIPVVTIENKSIFNIKNGNLKELNERCSYYYLKVNRSTRKLNKYLELNQFYELQGILKDLNNTKTFHCS